MYGSDLGLQRISSSSPLLLTTPPAKSSSACILVNSLALLYRRFSNSQVLQQVTSMWTLRIGKVFKVVILLLPSCIHELDKRIAKCN